MIDMLTKYKNRLTNVLGLLTELEIKSKENNILIMYNSIGMINEVLADIELQLQTIDKDE